MHGNLRISGVVVLVVAFTRSFRFGTPASFGNGACRTVHTYRCVRACIAQSTGGDDDGDDDYGTDDYYGGGGVGYSLPSWA
jgi:hypothetical protein